MRDTTYHFPYLSGGPRPLAEEIEKEYPNGMIARGQLFGYGSHSQEYIDIIPNKEAKEYLECLSSDTKYRAFTSKYTFEQLEFIRLSLYRPDRFWFTWEDFKNLIKDPDVENPIEEIKKIIEKNQITSLRKFSETQGET